MVKFVALKGADGSTAFINPELVSAVVPFAGSTRVNLHLAGEGQPLIIHEPADKVVAKLGGAGQ